MNVWLRLRVRSAKPPMIDAATTMIFAVADRYILHMKVTMTAYMTQPMSKKKLAWTS